MYQEGVWRGSVGPVPVTQRGCSGAGRHRSSRGTGRKGCFPGRADPGSGNTPCAATAVYLLYRVWGLNSSRFFKAQTCSQDLPWELGLRDSP